MELTVAIKHGPTTQEFHSLVEAKDRKDACPWLLMITIAATEARFWTRYKRYTCLFLHNQSPLNGSEVN